MFGQTQHEARIISVAFRSQLLVNNYCEWDRRTLWDLTHLYWMKHLLSSRKGAQAPSCVHCQGQPRGLKMPTLAWGSWQVMRSSPVQQMRATSASTATWLCLGLLKDLLDTEKKHVQRSSKIPSTSHSFKLIFFQSEPCRRKPQVARYPCNLWSWLFIGHHRSLV